MNQYQLREGEIVSGYSLQNALEKAGYRYTSMRHAHSQPDGNYVVHLCGCMDHASMITVSGVLFPKWLNKPNK